MTRTEWGLMSPTACLARTELAGLAVAHSGAPARKKTVMRIPGSVTRSLLGRARRIGSTPA
jgi:hypothetical protein